MEVKQDYRTNQKRIFQYILGIMGIISVFSLIFIGTYLYLDYHNYFLSFERAQQSDLKIAQEKISSNIDSLKKLSLLTSKRIVSSLGSVQRIHNILSSSSTLLPETELLKIQKITYKKLSHPSKLITRFGHLPIEPKITPSDTPHENNPLIFLDQNGVNSKTWIFDQEGHLDGILEMEVPLSYFKDRLNIGSTLSFIPDKTHVLLQKDPLSFYGKLPDSFWEYGIKNRGHFAVFLLFMFFSLFAIAVSSHYLRLQIKKSYQEGLDKLSSKLCETQEEEHKTKETLFINEQQTQAHQTACQSYKKFQTSFQNHHREQVHHILRSLDVVMKSFKNPNISLPTNELIEIVGSCITVAEHISDGIPSLIKQESIKIIRVLEEVRALFTEKIYKSNLTMVINCSEALSYKGDSVFLKVILINVIGKTLFMIPKNGKVEIKATHQKEGIQIQVKDNGFPFDDKSQYQIKQSFDFFMSNELFRNLCQDSDFVYEYIRAEDGLNLTKIIIPKSIAKAQEDNVVPLFH